MAALQSNAPFGKLFIVGKDGDKDLEFLIDKPSITIGRDKSCDIVIVRREISRKHAQLAVDDDGMVWLSSLGRDPVSVNGKPATEPVELYTGDTIAVHLEGRDRLFRFEGEDETIQINRTTDAAPGKKPLGESNMLAAAGAPLPAQLKDAITAGASNLRKVAGGANNQENWPAKPAVAAPSGAPAAAPFVPSATALQALRAGLRKTKQQAADEAAASAADAAPEPAQVPGKAPAVVSESAQAPVEAPIAAPKSAVKKPRPSRGAEGSYEQAKPVKKAKTVRFQMEEALASPEGVPQDITFTLEVDMAGSEVIQVDADSTMALSAWAMGTAADASAAIPGSAPKPRPTPKRKLSGGSLASGGRRRSTPRKASAAKMAEVEAEDRADAEKEAALDDQEMPAAATAADGSAPNGEDVTMAVAPMQLHFPASEGADEAEAADKTTDLSELAPSAGITVTAGPERDAGEQTTDLANIEIGPAAAALATAAAATPGPSAMPKNEDAADELSEEEEAESENEEAADDVTVELAPATGAKAPQCTPAAGFVPNSFFGAMEPSLLSIRLTEIAGAQTPGTAAALTPAGTLHIDVPRSVLARASASAAKSARARLSSVTKPGSPDAEAALEGALSALEELISAASAGRVAANCTDGAQLAPAVTASSESAGVVPGSAVARTPRAVARVAAQEITVAVPQGFLQSPAARQGFTLQISEDLVHGATPAQVAALERASEQDYTVEIPQHMFATPAPISACRQAAAQEADVDAEMAEDDAAMDQLVRETPTALMPGRPPLVAPIAMAQLDAADAALGAEASEVVPARELPVQELQAAELHAADQHAEAMVVNTDSAAAATPAGQQVLAAAKLLKRANLRARAAYTKAKVLEVVVVRPASAPAAAAVRRTFQQAGAVVVLRPSPRAVRLPAEEVVPAGTPRSVAMSATAASSTKARRSSPRILLVSRSIPRLAAVNAAVDTSMGEADAPPAAGPEAGTGMPTGETAAAAPAEVDAEMAEAADLASGVPAAEALVEAAAEAVADATNPTAASPAAGLPAEQPDLQPATELAAEAASDPASAMAIDVEPVVAQSDSSPVTAQLASKSGDAKSAASEVCYVCCAAEEGDVLLLCDSCDAACHLGCCAPPLKRVPKGDWFCRDCAAKNAARAEQEAAAKAEAARLAAEMAEAAKKAAADVEAAAPARKSSRRASMSPAVATGLAKPSTSNGSRRSSLAPSAAAAAEETAATTEEAESKPAAQKRGSRRASMAPAQKLPEAGPEAAEKPATRRGTKRGAGAAPAPDTGLVEDIKEPAAAAVEAPAEPAEEKPAKRASRRASVAATSQPAEAKAAKPATTGAKRTRRGQSPSERAQAAAMALGVLDPIMEGNEEEGEEPVPAAPAAPAVKGRATRAKAVAAAAPAEEDDAAPAKRTRASASTPATEAPARKATRGSARARK
ncbi:hypothetical protein WJX72_006239 [[Myrmecia] bisecta]|uniref:PHD-type domain-containing protein n=1 Tax=[Myrmecia] bisecta TaxID=41462 RepID=A0AAW1Q382_9CHLO